MSMEKLLISACLAGENCKYSGGNNFIGETALASLGDKYELVSACPEVMGGLSVPRIPCERIGARVMNERGEDVTAQFKAGAELTADICERQGIKKALLKEKSPSCGSGRIYDGTFSHTVIAGDGVTAQRLRALGIALYGESEIEKLI